MSDRQRKRNAKTRRRMLKALASPPVATDPRVTLRVEAFDYGCQAVVTAQAEESQVGVRAQAKRWRRAEALIARMRAEAEDRLFEVLSA